jgi:hypothetical protein
MSGVCKLLRTSIRGRESDSIETLGHAVPPQPAPDPTMAPSEPSPRQTQANDIRQISDVQPYTIVPPASSRSSYGKEAEAPAELATLSRVVQHETNPRMMRNLKSEKGAIILLIQIQ